MTGTETDVVLATTGDLNSLSTPVHVNKVRILLGWEPVEAIDRHLRVDSEVRMPCATTYPTAT